MSIPNHTESVFDDNFDDIWFDASDEQVSEALEDHDGEIHYDMKASNEYVPDPEKNHDPKLPVLEFHQNLLIYLHQGDVFFKTESFYFEKFQQYLKNLVWLQRNHENQIRKQDRKFKAILSRVEEAKNRQYDPENMPTNTICIKEKLFYAAKLTECTRTKIGLEKSYMDDFHQLKGEALALSDKLQEQQNLMFDFQQGFANQLASEDRLRWMHFENENLNAYNLEAQELLAEQSAKIQQLENDKEELRRATDKEPYIYHQTFLKIEEQIIADKNKIRNQPEQEHNHNEEIVNAPYDEDRITGISYASGQLPKHQSCYEDLFSVEDGADGRLYALWSRNQMKREFAIAKYERDMDKRHQDMAELAVNPQCEADKSIRHWMDNVNRDIASGDDADSSEAGAVADPGRAGKRTFSDSDDHDDEAEGQQGRKRVRTMSGISRTPSQQLMMARFQREDSNVSKALWEDPGHYGHDGKYYPADRHLQSERPIYSFLASGTMEPRFRHRVDSKNGGPPLRRNSSLSHRSSPRRRAPNPPTTLASHNILRKTTSSVRRLNNSAVSASIVALSALDHQVSPVHSNKEPNQD